MKKNLTKKILAGILAASLAAGLVPMGNGFVQAEEKEAKTVGEAYQSGEQERQHMNFNREWKFYRGDVEHGADENFDDSEWTDVALPHNFSVPYDMTSTFYVGYGWYRKEFDVTEEMLEKRVSLEFEGVFQVAELYVNGQEVGVHEGGYTGFEYDITDYLKAGNNQIAVRVNNIWQHDLTPRAGDHQFTGGIYRDVYLNVTDDVHVTWYGTFVTTPDLLNPAFDESAVNVLDSYTPEEEIWENLEKKQSNVNVQTEVKNDSEDSKTVFVTQEVVDAENKVVAEFSSPEQVIEAGEIYNFNDTSEQIKDIQLWDTENPYLYTVYTTVYSDGEAVDTYESPLGFRCAQYKNDGFYLNGEKTLLDGANVHQDHGGWADAVTNKGFERDVRMLKEAGMNFIRGSHYPHDPSFAEACDENGMLFWSESVFWGMGGCSGKDADPTMSASDWLKDAYPQNPEDEEAFEESCKQALTDMIRVNRNHPSIINWSMGNEVFFTASGTQQKAKNLVNELRNLSHKLDPTRKAGMGGVQREGYDKIEVCDIAGYNGDGGKFTNLEMPNLVAEYGSKTADRPGQYRPFYDQIAKPGSSTEYQLKENSGGLALWCAFHHGTVGGEGLAKMGMIDYYRLPLNSWYWYREHNTGVAPEQSKEGTAAKMEITASQTVLNNNGTDDTQIIVTMKDDNDEWVNQTQEVTLKVVAGPGVFPTGKEYTFIPNRTIRDGKAAIEFRSYYSGETMIVASANGLPDAEIRLTTVNTSGAEEGEEPEGFYVAEEKDNTEKIEEPVLYGTANVASGRPAFPSSNDEDRTLAVDGDIETSWTAGNTGSGEYWMTDLEFAQYLYKVKLGFNGTPYPYKIEVSMDKDAGPWTTVAEYTKENLNSRPVEESIDGTEARFVKITFTDVPEDEKAFLSECEVYGVTSAQSPQYKAESTYLSDMEYESGTTGWKEIGIDQSCEGNPITLGGKVFKKGLGVHANSQLIYNLDGKYTRFQAAAGIDDETGSSGDAIFRVFADDKLVYEKNLTGGSSDEVDLSVSGVKKLKLVTDQNGSDSNDHTDWADAKVLGAIRDITKDKSEIKVSFTSNTQELKAGNAFEAMVNVANESKQLFNGVVSMALYDSQGNFVDVVRKPVNYIAKGKSVNVKMSMDMPAEIIGGYVKINVYEKDTLKLAANTTYASAGAVKLSEAKTALAKADGKAVEEWVKVDGEDVSLEKAGNWAMWPSGNAYQGTETYVENNNWQGSYIAFKFTGTQIRVGAKVDGSCVGADAYIDGVKVAEINTKGEPDAYKQVWESEVLEQGEHTLKLVPRGKFGLDYLEYHTGIVDKSELRESLDKAGMLDKALYTEETWAVFIEKYRYARAILEDENAAALDVRNAIQGLEEGINQLVTKSFQENMKLVKHAFGRFYDFLEKDVAAEYKADLILAVAKTEENLSSIYMSAHTTEEELVASAKELHKALDALVKDEGEEADKADLEALITYAQYQQLALGYIDVVPAVKNALEAALDKAVEVRDSESATQDDVDKAYGELLKMVQMLDFTGNNTSLSKMVQQVENLKGHLYTAATWKVFADARTKAQGVLGDENSLQAEIDEARVALRNAIFQLRLIPDKGQLEGLIKSAEVKAAEKALEEAQKNLVAKADADKETGSKDDNKVVSDNGSKKEASKSAAKTGDAGAALPAAVAGAAALAVVMAFKKKR